MQIAKKGLKLVKWLIHMVCNVVESHYYNKCLVDMLDTLNLGLEGR